MLLSLLGLRRIKALSLVFTNVFATQKDVIQPLKLMLSTMFMMSNA